MVIRWLSRIGRLRIVILVLTCRPKWAVLLVLVMRRWRREGITAKAVPFFVFELGDDVVECGWSSPVGFADPAKGAASTEVSFFVDCFEARPVGWLNAGKLSSTNVSIGCKGTVCVLNMFGWM